MGIESRHPSYMYYADAMVDCRNAFEGSRAIKAARERYLPGLSGQTAQEYNAYLTRALFFSITRKTVDALVGMVMARTPITKGTEGMESYFVENQGAQFLEIISTTIQEVLLEGGYGILIDAPEGGGEPSFARYARESIINWRVDDFGNPTMVVLEETVFRQKADDEYEFEGVKQFRRLALEGGIYTIRVFNDKKEEFSSVVPTVNGRPLGYIPFYLINPLGVSMEVHRPPMMDIVDLNLSHYRTSADLEHGRHFTGLPTPVISGVEAGTELHIGSSSAWVLPDSQGKAYYLEFTGQGLQSLEKALTEKQSQMASMSARLLDNSKRGSEAAETVKLRYMSETSALVTVVRSVEEGINKIYGVVAQMKGVPEPTIQMNKEFMDPKLSAQEITALTNSYLEGAISKETLIYNLRKGDVISPARTDEEEIATLEQREAERRAAEAAARTRISSSST